MKAHQAASWHNLVVGIDMVQQVDRAREWHAVGLGCEVEVGVCVLPKASVHPMWLHTNPIIGELWWRELSWVRHHLAGMQKYEVEKVLKTLQPKSNNKNYKYKQTNAKIQTNIQTNTKHDMPQKVRLTQSSGTMYNRNQSCSHLHHRPNLTCMHKHQQNMQTSTKHDEMERTRTFLPSNKT